MNINEFVAIERKFLREQEAEVNENGVYLYTSKKGHDHISLDHYLKEYKDWLIENKIVTILHKKV